MKVNYSKKFLKQFQKSPNKIKIAFRKRLILFCKDQEHPLLNKHGLLGEYHNYYSINITGDWRAIFKKLENSEIIFFLMIGTHSELYK